MAHFFILYFVSVVIVLLLRKQFFDSAVSAFNKVNNKSDRGSYQHVSDDDQRALQEEGFRKHIDDRIGHRIKEPVIIAENNLMEDQEERIKIDQSKDPDYQRQHNGYDRAVPEIFQLTKMRLDDE